MKAPALHNPLPIRSSGTRTTGTRTDYGVSMRFQVRIGTSTSLGRWATCSGLGLQLKLDEFVSGGAYADLVRLPGELRYSQVTLERAVNKQDSYALYLWLQEIREWVASAGETPTPPPQRSVMITMLSGQDWKPIFTWTLLNAFPVQWSGPSLSAKGGDVAVERLVLSYDGLEAAQGDGNGPRLESQTTEQRPSGLLTLSAATKGGSADGPLEFVYTPQRVQMEVLHHVDNKTLQLAADSASSVVESGQVSVSFSDLRIEGVEKVAEATRLFKAWMAPQAGGAKARAATPGAKTEPKAVELLVSMGQKFLNAQRVTMRSVNLTFTRFTPSGDPCRATAGFRLQQCPPEPGAERRARRATVGPMPTRPAAKTRLGNGPV